MSQLVLLKGGAAIPYALADGVSVLGRHPDCAIQLQSGLVSRRHAQVSQRGNDFLLEDLGSGNGTFLNGKPITEPVRLKHGDRVKIGPLLLRFEDPDSAEAGAATVSDFQVRFADDDEDNATITGKTEQAGGFGMLDTNPQAKLKAVIDISRSLAGVLDLGAILPKIIKTLFEVFPYADRGCILLKNEVTGEMVPQAYQHRRDQSDDSVKLSRTIIRKVLEEKSGILSADAASDTQFEPSESIASLKIRSMMCAPLIGLDGEPLGLIHIDTLNPFNQFKNDDLELLMAVAGQAALSYENARLFETSLQKQKQDRELQIARDVQRALLPEELPAVPGYEFYASYESAQAVGGDYYDALMLDENKICLSFGDVAGKGVPGALIMSRISSCVQNTMGFTHDVERAVTAINNHMCDNAVEGRFVTFILIVIDLSTHEMSLVNAGHMSPMILQPDGTIDEFSEDTAGLPIGVVEDYPFEVVTRRINPGEVIVLFTDGVDEAMNPAGDLYTLERMRQFISARPRNARELGEDLLSDVRRHADGRPQNDDIAIMTIGRDA